MNQKPELSAVEIEQLLIDMAANNTLDVDLTDIEIESLLMNTPISSVNRAEQLTARAVLKMEAAQRKRERRLPTYELGQYLATVRLSKGLTVPQVAKQATISTNELETLESGIWSIDQIMQEFPSNDMARVLAAIQLAIRDFGDKLFEIANKPSLRNTSTTAYARFRHSSNATSAQLVESIAEYINEMQNLLS